MAVVECWLENGMRIPPSSLEPDTLVREHGRQSVGSRLTPLVVFLAFSGMVESAGGIAMLLGSAIGPTVSVVLGANFVFLALTIGYVARNRRSARD